MNEWSTLSGLQKIVPGFELIKPIFDQAIILQLSD